MDQSDVTVVKDNLIKFENNFKLISNGISGYFKKMPYYYDIHSGDEPVVATDLIVSRFVTIELFNKQCGAEADGVIISISNDEHNLTQHFQQGEKTVIDTSMFEGKKVTIKIDKNKNTMCDQVYIFF